MTNDRRSSVAITVAMVALACWCLFKVLDGNTMSGRADAVFGLKHGADGVPGCLVIEQRGGLFSYDLNVRPSEITSALPGQGWRDFQSFARRAGKSGIRIDDVWLQDRSGDLFVIGRDEFAALSSRLSQGSDAKTLAMFIVALRTASGDRAFPNATLASSDIDDAALLVEKLWLRD